MRFREQKCSRSGQTMVFMVLIIIILCLMLLWHFDFHKVLFVKTMVQNAGDAAALNAARWQGTTLNLIGDLNVMKAVALTQPEIDQTHTLEQMTEMQSRLCYVGPLLGLLGAQQAAKNNGIFNNSSFTRRLFQHAENVLYDYGSVFGEPYENCWMEYSDMIRSIAEQGVAAGPDNARYYTDYAGDHILLRLDFYDAVAGREWCWFWRNDLSLLENYTSYLYWPDLPPMEAFESSPADSEIFGLGLSRRTTGMFGDHDVRFTTERPWGTVVITNDPAALASEWYCYNPSRWSSWSRISRSGPDAFPVLGDVRPHYDYSGADAVVRVVAEADRVSPGKGGSHVTWTAAAKPFGYLDTPDGEIRPNTYAVVLPAFREVRLVPVDASSAPAGGAYDLDWRVHIEEHLPVYMENGIAGLDHDCYYCRQLDVWEEYEFRRRGIDWLNETNEDGELVHNCHRYSGPGGPGGGTRRGH